MTCNLTGAVCKSPDLAVKLSKSQVDAVFHQFLHGFYYLATGEIRNDGFGDLLSPPIRIPIDLPEIRSSKAGIYPTIKQLSSVSCENSGIPSVLLLKQQLIRCIRDSEGEIRLFAWSFDDRNDVVKEIILQLKSGKAVSIITNSGNVQIIKFGLKSLVQAGAKVYGIPYFHAKGIIYTENKHKKALIMTSNFEDAGLEFGFNTGISFNDEGQASKLDSLFDDWCRCAKYELVNVE